MDSEIVASILDRRVKLDKPVVRVSYNTAGSECPSCGLQAVVILDNTLTEGTRLNYDEDTLLGGFLKELACSSCELVFDLSWHE